MSLWMIRAEISIRDLMRWIGVRRLTDPDHAMHCLLVETFGREDSPGPFRAILPRNASVGTLHAYSTAPLSRLLDNQELYADPLQTRILARDMFSDKTMPESLWTEGRKMGFDVRVRPTRQVSWPEKGVNARSQRDAYANYMANYPGASVSRERIYAGWLAERFQRGGAMLEMDSVRLASFRQSRMHRQRLGPDAVMRGNITVTDATKFRRLVLDGVGRHKTYGYGMILPRPATAV